MFRLLIALALVATVSASTDPCAASTDVPGTVTDCSTLGSLVCVNTATTASNGDVSATITSVSCQMACTPSDAGGVVVTCPDSTTCNMGKITCNGAGALQISALAVMLSLVAAVYQL